jgi:phosphatidylserine/phosphatidylglycerophosphate/cardiolipin synthase-like enzyme
MFDSAQREIVFGQFYVAGQDGEALDDIMAHLDAAGRRGVKIRFLMEKKGEFASVPATIEKLKRIPNLEFRQIDYASMTGNGIIHAKYFVVDGQSAFVGSQNFDWRSFSHIHETGLKISDTRRGRAGAGHLRDRLGGTGRHRRWPAAGPDQRSMVPADPKAGNYLVASPNAFNPPGVGDSQSELVRLIGQARQEVRVQLLDYAPLSYGPNHTRPYYAVIDDALRAAATRGVKIKLMVSNWNTEHRPSATCKAWPCCPTWRSASSRCRRPARVSSLRPGDPYQGHEHRRRSRLDRHQQLGRRLSGQLAQSRSGAARRRWHGVWRSCMNRPGVLPTRSPSMCCGSIHLPAKGKPASE